MKFFFSKREQNKTGLNRFLQDSTREEREHIGPVFLELLSHFPSWFSVAKETHSFEKLAQLY